jgi:hypothetical protein
VFKVLKAHKVLRDHSVLQELLEHKEQLVLMVHVAHKVLKDLHQLLKVLLVRLEPNTHG